MEIGWSVPSLLQFSEILEEFAPLRLAESWDNVGFIVRPLVERELRTALLTIDWTDAVAEEALRLNVDIVLSYHPPIFRGLTRLTPETPAGARLLKAIGAGMAIYSPHTALDAADDGMTDFLVRLAGAGEARPIVPSAPGAGTGAGRVLDLHEPVALEEVLSRIKRGLGLSQVRLARSSVASAVVRSIAACPGAGGSVFEKLGHADLLLTGEMRHHDILSRTERGSHVVVTDHTNTERAYLKVLARRLKEGLPGLEVVVSETDHDPLTIT
jgi:dinuclear metal center YbgI/SA1388 family protein